MKRKIRKRNHLTVHITSTIKLNAVTNVDVRTEKGRDNIAFREHVGSVARRFNPKEWSGDVCMHQERIATSVKSMESDLTSTERKCN